MCGWEIQVFSSRSLNRLAFSGKQHFTLYTRMVEDMCIHLHLIMFLHECRSTWAAGRAKRSKPYNPAKGIGIGFEHAWRHKEISTSMNTLDVSHTLTWPQKMQWSIFTDLLCHDKPFSNTFFLFPSHSFTHSFSHVHKREMCIVRWAGFNTCFFVWLRWPDSYTPEFRQSYWPTTCLVVTPIGPHLPLFTEGGGDIFDLTTIIHLITYIVLPK